MPEPAAELRAGQIYADLSFPEPPPERPYTAINMVATADGRVTAGGMAGGIGGPVDRLVMRILRSKSDAVMVGAGTVRAEKINLGLPEDLRGSVHGPAPLGVVLSASGDVPLQNLADNDPERLLFLISHEADEETVERLSERGEVRRALAGYGDPLAALGVLREEYGVRGLLVEGGPGLNHALIRDGLADELFLTFTPKLAGGTTKGPGSILGGEQFDSPRGMRLVSVYEAGGELYLRYAMGE